MTLTAPYRALAATILTAAASLGCDAQATQIVPPTRPFLVVANQRAGVATIVEIGSGRVQHVPLGANPHEVAVTPNGRVALFTVPGNGFTGGGKVLVMDLATARVSRTMELAAIKDPHGVQFISDSIALVGALSGTAVAYVNVQGTGGTRVVEGLPENPYVIKTTRTGRAYVSSPRSSRVSEIDVASGRVLRTIAIENRPAGIEVSADGKELYGAIWTQNTGGGIAIYDLEKGAVVEKLPATQPRRMAVTADQRTLVVSDEDHVRLVNRATRQVRSVHVGQNSGGSGVACSPDSSRCYVLLSQAGEIVEIDVAAGTVLRRFAAQRGVDGAAYVPR